jgi:hypothetical protein
MTQPNGQLCCGGDAFASAQVLYIVVDKKTHKELSGIGVQVEIDADATAWGACANCGNTSGQWNFLIDEPLSGEVLFSGQGTANTTRPDSLKIQNNEGLVITSTSPAFGGVVHFFSPAAGFLISVGAFGNIEGAAAIDPTVTADDPNAEVVSMAPVNPNPGASVFTLNEVAAMSAQGADLSSFRSLGLLGTANATPEPSSLLLLGSGLLRMGYGVRRRLMK